MEAKLKRLKELIELKENTDHELALILGDAEPLPKRKWTRRTQQEPQPEITE